MLAAQAQVTALTADRVQLRLGVQSLVTESNRRFLEERLSAHFGRPFRVIFESGAVEAESTVAGADRVQRERERRELVERFRNDPLVRETIRMFGGEVDEASVRAPGEGGAH